MSRIMSRQVARALNDQNLQTALSRLVSLIKMGRQIAFAGVDFDGLSRKIHMVKERAIADLPRLTEEFKKNAAAAGATIYEARDGREANEYVLNLARQKGVKRIVKSKSMLTEEIGVREHMERAGIEVTETDIGEWIIQLAGERPAHLVGPAIHKTIEQVAELFSRATGRKLEPEPQLLLDVARDTLRQCYIDAQMGISGANMAIAETGTLAIVTNEGNGCMVTTLPPVHVAVVGYEKIVATWEDTAAILRLLSRSTASMKMPIYVSYITGPSTIASSLGTPAHAAGPAELHIVLVDNGRWEMWQSPDFREALYCIKCGACLNACPVFASLAGQVYGYVYQGGIGAILTAFHHGLEKARDPASLCLGCMACREVCPARIDIPQLVLRLKSLIAEKKGLPWTDRFVYGAFLKHPRRLDAAARAVYYLEKRFAEPDSVVRHLPRPLNTLTNAISLPAISPQPLRQRLAHLSRPGTTGQPKVALFAGCVGNYVYPETCEQAVETLRRHGADVYFPAEQGCCGAPAYFSGDTATSLSLAETNIAALEKHSPDYIVTLCPGCAVMLKQKYLLLTLQNHSLNKRAMAIADKVRDYSQLILELAPAIAPPTSLLGQKVTYHDPCHLKRGLGITAEPRALLQRLGYEIVEMADPDACCGFGGRVVLDYPQLSASVLKRKLDAIEATSATTVVTSCLPCVLQLRGGLDKRHGSIKVLHIAELLAKH